jgi:hypothetical protein
VALKASKGEGEPPKASAGHTCIVFADRLRRHGCLRRQGVSSRAQDRLNLQQGDALTHPARDCMLTFFSKHETYSGRGACHSFRGARSFLAQARWRS